ncbi:MAG: hypothetical protein ACRDR6_08895 [Pseudonocardiaceae bacterium]
MGEPRSQKQRREQLVHSLRDEGKSRVDVAEVLRRRYRFNARVALRYAHGWSQRQAADEWNRRWPDELKTFKSFSYWEQWPSRTGHVPSFDNLAKLAELYQCAVSDLLADLPDFRHLDTAADAPETATGLPLPDNCGTSLAQRLESLVLSDRDALSTPRDRDQAYHQLVQFLSGWAHTMDRRNMLRALRWAVTTASLPLALDGDAYQRVISAITGPGRVDVPTIEHIEAVLWHCNRQDHALGPQAALDTVLAQRDLARALVPGCPAELRPRLLSAVSQASSLAGWLSFDLNQFDHAGYYYEDARTLAHEAENTGLGGLVLCHMSHLATWRGTPRIGIDHAVAAGQWADRTDDLRLRAYTADVAARAYAADGQRDACVAALDTAHTLLTKADYQAPSHATYNETAYISIRGGCHLTLGETDHAISYAQQSLTVMDRISTRDVAMTLVYLGQAHVQCNEIDEAARLLGDAGDIVASHSSARLIGRLEQARADLQPWQRTAAVRTLDDRLASLGLA